MGDVITLMLPTVLLFSMSNEIAAQKQLEGTWIVESETWAGWQLPDELRATEIVVKGNQYTEKSKEKSVPAALRFLPLRKIPSMDMVDRDQDMGFFEAIYKLDKDTLTICYKIRRSQDRPTEFNAGPDSANALLVLKRKKDT